MADGQRILRFPISGKEHEYFILEVTSNGSKPLDLKLRGSEGTASFLAKLRHKRIGELKAQPGHCTDEEWEGILISALNEDHVPHDISIKADIQSDATLNFRKNIQGITQRLGSIKLQDASENEEIDPFQWCVSVIGRRTEAVNEIAAAKAKAEALEKSVNELKGQLEDLIKAKEDDENQLLEKFRDLLNEKKLKIRQQQRLLATANVDEDKLAKIGGPRKAKASRSSKRKAKDEPSDDSDDGFDKMDIDGPSEKASPELDPDNVEPDTPQTTDEETQVETEEDESDQEPAATSKSRGDSATSAAKGASAHNTRTQAARDKTPEDPPPRRTLPFNKGKKTALAPTTKAAASADDETESDEEL